MHLNPNQIQFRLHTPTYLKLDLGTRGATLPQGVSLERFSKPRVGIKGANIFLGKWMFVSLREGLNN